MTKDHYWLIDDFSLHDSIHPYEIFRDNMFKFYKDGTCVVPRYKNGIPNSNRELVPYFVWKDNDVVKMRFKTDNPWLQDTFNIDFTSRMQGMHEFIEMHFKSDKLHYQLSHIK